MLEQILRQKIYIEYGLTQETQPLDDTLEFGIQDVTSMVKTHQVTDVIIDEDMNGQLVDDCLIAGLLSDPTDSLHSINNVKIHILPRKNFRNKYNQNIEPVFIYNEI